MQKTVRIDIFQPRGGGISGGDVAADAGEMTFQFYSKNSFHQNPPCIDLTGHKLSLKDSSNSDCLEAF